MSKSKQGSQSPQKRPKLGTRHGAVFTIEPEALQKMGPEGVDSLLRFLGNADPDGSTEPEEV